MKKKGHKTKSVLEAIRSAYYSRKRYVDVPDTDNAVNMVSRFRGETDRETVSAKYRGVRRIIFLARMDENWRDRQRKTK